MQLKYAHLKLYRVRIANKYWYLTMGVNKNAVKNNTKYSGLLKFSKITRHNYPRLHDRIERDNPRWKHS